MLPGNGRPLEVRAARTGCGRRRDVKCPAAPRTGARLCLRAKRFLLIFAVFDTTITRILGVQDRRTEIGPHSGIGGHFP